MALPQIDTLCQALDLPPNFVETATQLYRRALTEWEGTRNVRISVMAAVSVYVSCRVLHTPRTLRQVASASGVSLKLIAPVSHAMMRDPKVEPRPITPGDLLPKLSETLSFHEELVDRIESYLRVLTEQGYQSSGLAPATVLGAVAYAASGDGGWGYGQERIASALGITSISIRNRMPDLRTFLNKHLVEDPLGKVDKSAPLWRANYNRSSSALRTEEELPSGHLFEAIAHFNYMLDRRDLGETSTEQFRLLFDCLNKIQTARLAGREGPHMGEVAGFESMIFGALGSRDRNELVNNLDFRALVELQPQIMNQDTLRHGDYNPNRPVSEKLRTHASEEHRQLVNARDELRGSRTDSETSRFCKKLAQLLYVVRSNIAHGEKTPYGPDVKKRERDEEVSKVVIPILASLIDILLGFPSTKLVNYGTLARDRSNAQLLEGLGGSWEVCVIRGEIFLADRLPNFRWKLDGDEVPAQLFTATDLQSTWESLDSFEGDDYRRRLIPYSTSEQSGVSYVYLRSVDS